MNALLLAVAALWAVAGASADDLQDCLRKDSIQCVQLTAFRSMKAFFGQDSIALFGGLSLVRDAPAAEGARAVDDDLGRKVEAAGDVESREDALEAFALGEASAFLRERSLRFDFQPLLQAGARSVVESVPESVRNKLTEFMTEGRGKKKKILKALIPLLIGLKVKAAGALLLGILGVALLAKQALLVSLAALALSGFLLIKRLLTKASHPHHEVHEAHAAPIAIGGGYSGGGIGLGGGIGSGYGVGGGVAYESTGYSSHGDYGSHSSPIAAHSLAYSAHKPNRRMATVLKRLAEDS